DHDGAQTSTVIQCLAGNQDAGQQATDAAETVQHDISWVDVGFRTNDRRESVLQEGTQVSAFGFFEAVGQLSQVDRCSTKVHIYQFAQNIQGAFQWKFLGYDVAGVAVRLD